MLKEISTPQWQTTDERVFFDRKDAIVHQAALDNAEAIDAYAAQFENDRHQTRLKNTLTEYVQWLALRQAA